MEEGTFQRIQPWERVADQQQNAGCKQQVSQDLPSTLLMCS